MKTQNSWKTTWAGVFVALPQILHLIFPKVITVEIAIALSSLAAALGFVVAKDGNVTGGDVSNGQKPS